MKKNLICLILAALMVLSIMPASVFAAQVKCERPLQFEENIATELKKLNLFKGVSETDFALNRVPTRIEALVIMLRLMGKEAEILAGEYKHPFNDVPSWANNYVGYAYENGLTKGISARKFGTDNATDAQFLTFVLRAMGYSDADGDFTWDNPYDLAKKLGILTENVATGIDFLRADCAIISYNALAGKLKKQEKTLADKLISESVFTETAYSKAKKNLANINPDSADNKEVITLTSVLQESAAVHLSDITNISYEGFDAYCVNDSSTANLISENELKALLLKRGEQTSISNSQAKEDIDLLFRTLHLGYGPYYLYSKDMWDNAKAEILGWIGNKSSVNVSDLGEKIVSATSFMQDRHSFLYRKRNNVDVQYFSYYCNGQNFYKDKTGYYKNTPQGKVYFVSFNNPDVKLAYTLQNDGAFCYSPVLCYLGTNPSSCTINLKKANGETFSENINWNKCQNVGSERNGEPNYLMIQSGNVAYVRLKSFQDKQYATIFEQFKADASKLASADVIIFDLRSNTGGNQQPMNVWLKTVTGSECPRPMSSAERISAINGGSVNEASKYGHKSKTGLKELYDNKQLFVVLIDDITASAGEGALTSLRELKNVIVIGSNTAGYQLSSGAVSVWLPNSGICSQIGTTLRFEYKMQSIDGRGMDPDVWCNPSNALPAVFNMLVKNNEISAADAKALQSKIR